MAEKLSDLIKQLAATDPGFLTRLEQAASAGLKADKLAVYGMFIKENKTFNYDEFNKVLSRHENSRIDINWNVGEYIYRIVVSRRKKQEKKERKERTKKGGPENNGKNLTVAVETESNSTDKQ